MFNFGRKREKEDKEKKKKDKKERRKQYLDSMSQDELTRLDELRKSLGSKSVVQAKSPEKLSGITADYRDQDQESGSSSNTSSSVSLNRPTSLISPTSSSTSFMSSSASIPPPLPARPPPKRLQKKSILKSSKSYDVTRSVSSDLDDANILLKNTKENEYINVYKKGSPISAMLSALSPVKSSSSNSSSGLEFQDREVPFEMAQATIRVRPHSDHVSPVSTKLDFIRFFLPNRDS